MRAIGLDGVQRCKNSISSEVGEEMSKVDDVTEAMKDVVDPELGINVVDLGLIYDVMVDDANTAVLNMTLTSAACPLQDVIEDQTRAALAGITDDVKINWVWMPPWGPDKISDDGRDQLRALGFTV
ncbi:MAG: hypothetical protein RL193_467 [Actinomycetota bacterium]|jgi:metal-sulfur cluster biosynthetic enzyme